MKGDEPLRGRRIVVTRPRAQSLRFTELLEAAGAEVLEAPLLQIIPANDPEPLSDAARRIGDFDWIVFTSVNGVESFWGVLSGVGTESAMEGVRICAIGPATAEAIVGRGGIVHMTAAVYTAEGVLDALASEGLKGRRILLPQADKAREVLASGLRDRGAEVLQVEAYRTVPSSAATPFLQNALVGGTVDMVTFTSGSAARSFVEAVGIPSAPVAIASIGPITSAVARDVGLKVDVEAEVHSVEGLAESIVRYYAGGGQ